MEKIKQPTKKEEKRKRFLTWLHWNEFDQQMAAMKSKRGHFLSHVNRMKTL